MNKKIKKDYEKTEQPENNRVNYTVEEAIYRGYLIQQMNRAADARNRTHPEFDDMTYLEWHESNGKAANAYIPPKRNKTDTRVVTGTTQEKGITLLSALLNYNLEPNVTAFDKQDLPIVEIGENMEDMITKSQKIENYDTKRALIYKELLDQGTNFVEELHIEEQRIAKDFKFDFSEGVKINKMKWTEKLEKTYSGCRVSLISGVKVFLGNMREYHISKQPFLYTVESVPYRTAQAIYQGWERWDKVPKKVVRVLPAEGAETVYTDWTLDEIENEMVEIIKYQDKWNNEYMIIINGVMMLPVGFPLTAISPSGEYTIVKGVAEPISEFFPYGKSSPAKSKTDQAVLDEMLRLMVLKTQQSYKPPMANRTKKILSQRIFQPGTIHADLDPNMIKPIIEPSGVTPAEFSAFELIKRIIDEKTVSPQFSGNAAQGSQTATEIMELKKQQMMKLGLLIWGVMELEKGLCWLRIQNILEHWTKPIDTKVDSLKDEIKNVYRTISVETNLDGGQKGIKQIEFNPELAGTLTSEQVKAEEDFLSSPGSKVRKTYINPEVLRALHLIWYITITPTEKDSSELDRVLFTQNIKDASELFGFQSMNLEYLRERFAILAKEDPNKFFIKEVPSIPQAEADKAAENQGKQLGGDMAAQMGEGIKKPSLKQMVEAS